MQPDPLDELIDSLTALRALRGADPVEGARRCPALQDAAKAALRAARAAFVLEAGDPPHRLQRRGPPASQDRQVWTLNLYKPQSPVDVHHHPGSDHQ